MPTTDTITGRRIAGIRPLTRDDLESEGWSERNTTHFAIVLDDGTLIYASRDPEGNGPGALFGRTPDGEHITIGARG